MKVSSLAVGQVYANNQGCRYVISEIHGALKVIITFLDGHGLSKCVQASAISLGTIRNPFHPSVFGVGYVGSGRFTSTMPQYKYWARMLTRCYADSYKGAQPTYKDCFVCDEWHDYQSFAEWISSLPQWGRIGFELDKDLIEIGNKEYCPGKCSLVPGAINCLIATRSRKNDSPLGACFNRQRQMYSAFCMDGDGVNRFLGYYADAQQAFSVYKQFKESVIKKVALRLRCDIDSRVFEALMNYEVLPS